MMHDPSTTERMHRANQAEAPITLIPKRCTCGRAAPAKQLVQHERCVTCLLADRVATLEEGDLGILRWMLGAKQSPRAHWGMRNHYLANRQDLAALQRLVCAGFARPGEQILRLRYFHATAAGCKLAGLNAAALRRAMGVQP